MARISNCLLTFLNILTVAVSLCVIFASLVLYAKVESPCDRVLRMPLLIMGGALLGVSMIGLLGSCCGISFFMWIYVIFLFLLILAITVFTLFTIVVTHKGIGEMLNVTGTEELRKYSGWLQTHVVNDENWDEIKSCMVKASMCQFIEAGKVEEVTQKLSQVQSGCCKPPSGCGGGKGAPEQVDCKAWSTDPTRLCFDCTSCKTATLDNIRGEWRVIAIFNACVLVAVMLIYSIGCCALRNTQHRSHKKRPPPGYYY